MPTTTTTVVTPGQVAALQQALTSDLAKTSVITAFVVAKQVASGAPAPPPPPAEMVPAVDSELLKVAATELRAARAKEGAQAGFDSERRRLGALAVVLYVRSDRAVPLTPAEGDAALRTTLLNILLARERPAYSAAKRRLDEATQTLAAAKATADNLVNARAAALEKVVQAGASTTTTSAAPGTPTSPAPLAPGIIGPTILTSDELTGWYASTAHTPHLTVPLPALAGYYQSIGATDQVRADIAFAQAVLETGYFVFPAGGQLTPSDNNFAGIGACDGCVHGYHFPDAQTGVAAHLQLLHEYATTQPIPGPLSGPVGVSGCCPTWMTLTGKWASAVDYGYAILNVYRHMLERALSQRASAVSDG